MSSACTLTHFVDVVNAVHIKLKLKPTLRISLFIQIHIQVFSRVMQGGPIDRRVLQQR